MSGLDILIAALRETQFPLISIVILSLIGIMVALIVGILVLGVNAFTIWLLVDAIKPAYSETNPTKPKIYNRTRWVFVVVAAILAAIPEIALWVAYPDSALLLFALAAGHKCMAIWVLYFYAEYHRPWRSSAYKRR